MIEESIYHCTDISISLSRYNSNNNSDCLFNFGDYRIALHCFVALRC